MENHLGEGVSSAFTLCSTSAYLRQWERNMCWEITPDSSEGAVSYPKSILRPFSFPGAPGLWQPNTQVLWCTSFPVGRVGRGVWMHCIRQRWLPGYLDQPQDHWGERHAQGCSREAFLHHQKPGKAVTLHISLTWLQRDEWGQSVVTAKICSLPRRSCSLSSLHRSNLLCVQSKTKINPA